jgi:hypothetical protein
MINEYISITHSREPISFDSLKLRPRQELHLDWQGAPLGKPFSWHLTKTSESLYVLIELPNAASNIQKHRPGTFVEGLWEQDVVELFIGQANSARYQEWNLSADGAWWAMSFKSYRERDPNSSQPKGIEIFISREDNTNSWIGGLKIPLGSLEVPLSQESTVHIAGIIYPQDGARNKHPCYLTSAAPKTGEPDFHDPGCFIRLNYRE